MPNRTPSRTQVRTPSRTPARSAPKGATPSVRDAADALYRAAKESCHQHSRLAHVHRVGVDDAELEGVHEVAKLCDRIVVIQTGQYEAHASAGRGDTSEGLWHAANSLYMACREYNRRHAHNDTAAVRLKGHDAAQLGELTMEYELEMSARLAVKQALASYAQLRPEVAERRSATSTSVSV